MRIADFLKEQSVIARMTARNKDEALAELAGKIAEVHGLDRGAVLKVLEERERLGSTGIGDGVAIPHGRMTNLDHLVALLGRSVEGIDFGAIDGRPTHLFFVLLTPDNNVGLQALARVSRTLRRPECRQALMQAPDAASLYQALIHEDSRL